MEVGCRDGRPRYEVSYHGEPVVEPSPLGLSLERGSLCDGFRVASTTRETVDERWTPVAGRYDEIRDHHEEAVLELERPDGMLSRLDVVFRAFDDGVGFRYEVPEQPGVTDVAVTEELTGFVLSGDYAAWWIPGDYDSYEYRYEATPASEVERAHTPLTMRAESDCYLSVHEAALDDYAAMTVSGPAANDTSDRASTAEGIPHEVTLTPLPDGTKVRATVPHSSPWRTLQLGTDPGDLVESSLVVNLNDPPAIDAEWVSPGTYVGIWWAMHIGKATWAPGPVLGATTENAKEYVDFAAEHDVPMLLVEGWNEGWEGDWSDQDFTTSNPQYDLREVVAYGEERGVDLVAHCETGADFLAFEDQLDRAFSLYEDLGIPAVKTGYVGDMPEGHHHHDQRLVNHHRRVVEAAAEHGLMLDVHEGVKPTGTRRTFPNVVTRECVRGMEYNAWSEGNPPRHTVVLPFTRMLAGPLDYTPGIFDVRFPEYGDGEIDGPDERTRVHTTRARQLALLVILYSGLQMAADLPENYRGEPEFEFVRAVPATWDDTRVPNAAIGEYVTVARRHGDEWFVASATDEDNRHLEVPLDVLGEGTYEATIYRDADDCDVYTNPEAVAVDHRTVTSGDTVTASMVGGGGHAMHVRPR